MRGNETPVLEQKWWSKNKPKSLKSTGFGKVLAVYEKANKSNSDLKLLKDQWEALEKIPAAAIKAAKMCDPKKHAETLKVLGKYADVVKKKQQALGAILDEMNDEFQTFLDTIGASERLVDPVLKKVLASNEVIAKAIKASNTGQLTKSQQLAPLVKLLQAAQKDQNKNVKMCQDEKKKLESAGMTVVRTQKKMFDANKKAYATILGKIEELKKALSIQDVNVKILKKNLSQVTVS